VSVPTPTLEAALEVIRDQDRIILAVLTIHKPCHRAAGEAWGCELGHYDDMCSTGIPESEALCVACTYDDRQATWPCETAQALGVTG
jgi:hypothetical protein